MAGVSVGGYVGSLRELYFRDRRHDSGHQRVEDNTEGVKMTALNSILSRSIISTRPDFQRLTRNDQLTFMKNRHQEIRRK